MGYRGDGLPIFSAGYATTDTNAGAQGGNVIGFDFKAAGIEDALAAVNSATDINTYMTALGNLVLLENQKLPYLYMWVSNRYGAASNKLENFYWFPAPAGGPYDDHAEKWYIAA